MNVPRRTVSVYTAARLRFFFRSVLISVHIEPDPARQLGRAASRRRRITAAPDLENTRATSSCPPGAIAIGGLREAAEGRRLITVRVSSA